MIRFFYLINIFKHIVALDYTGLMFYILKGGQVYPVPPCLPYWLRPVLSPVMSSCLLGLSCRSLCRLRPSALGCLRGWGPMNLKIRKCTIGSNHDRKCVKIYVTPLLVVMVRGTLLGPPTVRGTLFLPGGAYGKKKDYVRERYFVLPL